MTCLFRFKNRTAIVSLHPIDQSPLDHDGYLKRTEPIIAVISGPSFSLAEVL